MSVVYIEELKREYDGGLHAKVSTKRARLTCKDWNFEVYAYYIPEQDQWVSTQHFKMNNKFIISEVKKLARNHKPVGNTKYNNVPGGFVVVGTVLRPSRRSTDRWFNTLDDVVNYYKTLN